MAGSKFWTCTPAPEGATKPWQKLKLSLGELAGGFARLSPPQREWEPSLKHFLGTFLMLSLKTNKMKKKLHNIYFELDKDQNKAITPPKITSVSLLSAARFVLVSDSRSLRREALADCLTFPSCPMLRRCFRHSCRFTFHVARPYRVRPDAYGGIGKGQGDLFLGSVTLVTQNYLRCIIYI